MNVKMVSGSLKSQYNWGIKNYIINLVENIDKDVKISVIENSNGFMRYFKKPDFIKNLGDEDIVHLTSQTLGHVTKFNIKNTVITCHDMMAFSAPHLFESKRHAIFSRIAIKGMEKCRRIISVSEFTRNQISEHTSVDEEKITVIHSGINKNFKPMKKKNDIDYIVYFGSEEKRKNIPSLIDAFFMLKKTRPGLKLVKNYSNPEIWKRICRMGLEKDIIITGNLSEEQMAEYYSNAKAFVYPSLFEGFGFTPLEAMACGCPVASSNATSMPEILGDAPLYFNPLDTEEISDKVSMILDDKALSKKLSRKSLSRAKKFSWKTSARKTKRIYKEVMK